METRFAIQWSSMVTQWAGHGEPLEISEEDAQAMVEDLNREFPDIKHWYVKI